MNRFLMLPVVAVGILSLCFLGLQQNESSTAIESENVSNQQVEEPKPDSPDLALHWRMLAWMNSNGTVPAHAIADAVEARNAYSIRTPAPMDFQTAPTRG